MQFIYRGMISNALFAPFLMVQKITERSHKCKTQTEKVFRGSDTSVITLCRKRLMLKFTNCIKYYVKYVEQCNNRIYRATRVRYAQETGNEASARSWYGQGRQRAVPRVLLCLDWSGWGSCRCGRPCRRHGVRAPWFLRPGGWTHPWSVKTQAAALNLSTELHRRSSLKTERRTACSPFYRGRSFLHNPDLEGSALRGSSEENISPAITFCPAVRLNQAASLITASRLSAKSKSD